MTLLLWGHRIHVHDHFITQVHTTHIVAYCKDDGCGPMALEPRGIRTCRLLDSFSCYSWALQLQGKGSFIKAAICRIPSQSFARKIKSVRRIFEFLIAGINTYQSRKQRSAIKNIIFLMTLAVYSNSEVFLFYPSHPSTPPNSCPRFQKRR